MAQVWQNYLEDAQEAKRVANRLKDAIEGMRDYLRRNTNQAFDHAGDPKPGYIHESDDGTIAGLDFTRAELSNAIGSFDQIRKLLDNEATSQGNHWGNIEKVADARPN